MVKKEKEQGPSLEDTISILKEKFGEGAIMKLGEVREVDVEAIPTGSISLDLALGVGGVPKGRIVEIYGPESSGKTSLALHILAETQKRGGIAAFVDAEHALDPDYARRLGVKVDDILISQPDTGEQALDIVETLVKSGNVGLIVIDSVAALTPRVEIEGEMGDQHIGLQARLMSQALRKLTATAAKVGTTIIFLNQTRMKIGVLPFMNPETTPGGMALKFYSSVRIELRPRAKIKKGDEIIGNRIKAKVVKNKVAAPFKTTEFDIMYNKGISREGDLVNTGVNFGVLEKKGNIYKFKDQILGNGIEKAKDYLEENPKTSKELEKEIIRKWKEEAK